MEEQTEHDYAIERVQKEIREVVSRAYDDLREFNDMRTTSDLMVRLLRECAEPFLPPKFHGGTVTPIKPTPYRPSGPRE